MIARSLTASPAAFAVYPPVPPHGVFAHANSRNSHYASTRLGPRNDYFCRAKVITQFFSQVLPPSPEKACSKRAASAVMSV